MAEKQSRLAEIKANQLPEARLLPREEAILEIIESNGVESFFDILWESSYLYAGTGPILEAPAVSGMGRLKASIGFDIYQIDSTEADD